MIEKIKKVTIKDLLGIFKFLIVLIPSILYKWFLRLSKKELWLICETSTTARDNGYVFYKYMRKYHPELKTFYAISTDCYDYEKVKSLGNIIRWSSLKHYFIYMSCTKNISSHKEGNPNQTIFTILHLYLNLYNNRVFLQHGVLYQNLSMFHQKNTKFKMFICGAKPEYDFVKEKFGYTNEVKYTGLARFDNLHENEKNSKVILYMPTWRRWITDKNEMKKTLYYQNIMSFINSKKLDELLIKNDKYLYFCPHGSLKNLCDEFKTDNSRVKIVDIKHADIQELLKGSSMLITDYSSVHTDFAYMKKAICYYQYDEEEFKTKHIGKNAYDTYYQYKKDGFGPVTDNETELLSIIEEKINSNFTINSIYEKRINDFFPLNDKNNCERIYNEIK